MFLDLFFTEILDSHLVTLPLVTSDKFLSQVGRAKNPASAFQKPLLPTLHREKTGLVHELGSSDQGT